MCARSITTVREYLPERRSSRRKEGNPAGRGHGPGRSGAAARDTGTVERAAARALDDRDIMFAASGGSAIERERIAATGSFCYVQRYREWQTGPGCLSEGSGGAGVCAAGLFGGGGCAGGSAFRKGCGCARDCVAHYDDGKRIMGRRRGLGGAGLLRDRAADRGIREGDSC